MSRLAGTIVLMDPGEGTVQVILKPAISILARVRMTTGIEKLQIDRERFNNTKLSSFGISCLLPVFIVLVWDLSVRLHFVPNTILATPAQTVNSFLALLSNGILVKHIVVSGIRMALGLLLGLSLGFCLGLIVAINQVAYRAINFTVSLFAPIPPIAFTPLVIVAFGIDDGSKIALIALGTFFIVYAGTVAGIRSTERRYVEVGQLFEKSAWQIVRQILIPGAAYFAIENIRTALLLSWVLLLASELIASSSGLGWLIWDSRNFSRPDDMVVGMITVGVLGKLSDSLVVALQKRALRWRDDFSGLGNSSI